VSTAPSERLIGDLREKPIVLGALLVLATLLLYAPVAHHEFLRFDDIAYVADNVHVNTGLNLSNIVWAFTSFHLGNWHPVTWLSHMVDCQLFGLNSGPQHVINVLLHAANVLLLFSLLQGATGAVWRSCLAAALFAVHPLNVETVAWVAERKSLLCALFSLLAIAAYGWYVRRPELKKYLVVVAAFALALMSKPMAVSLPMVLLLLDYWPLERYEELPFRRKWVRLAVEKMPLLLMSAASSAVTIVAQRSSGAVADSSALPLSLRLGNAIVSYVAYIGKTVWPAKLAVFYPHPEHSLPWYSVAGSTVILVVITMAAFYFHRTRYFVVGWCLFVTTLIPVIGIVQVGRQAMADRYAYIPCIGLFIILVWGFSSIADKASMGRVVQGFASLCLIVAFTLASSHYLQCWQNQVSLFTQARNVAVRPDPVIEVALADGLWDAGRTDEALEHYQLGCALNASDPLCHYDIAQILFDKNEFSKAIEECHIAARLADNQRISDFVVGCFIRSGVVMMNFGAFDAAEREFEAALTIAPSDQTALHLREENLRRKKGGSH
jgi:hypothetical protein